MTGEAGKRRAGPFAALAAAACSALACAGLQKPAVELPADFLQEGKASFYGAPASAVSSRGAPPRQWDPGTSNGSHRTLPMGACVLVTNLENGSEARVHITDRGAFSPGLIIDLSYAAARKLQMLDNRDGVARVRLTPCSR